MHACIHTVVNKNITLHEKSFCELFNCYVMLLIVFATPNFGRLHLQKSFASIFRIRTSKTVSHRFSGSHLQNGFASKISAVAAAAAVSLSLSIYIYVHMYIHIYIYVDIHVFRATLDFELFEHVWHVF